MALAIAAALFALATTPIAFAVLGRLGLVQGASGAGDAAARVLVDRRAG